MEFFFRIIIRRHAKRNKNDVQCRNRNTIDFQYVLHSHLTGKQLSYVPMVSCRKRVKNNEQRKIQNISTLNLHPHKSLNKKYIGWKTETFSIDLKYVCILKLCLLESVDYHSTYWCSKSRNDDLLSLWAVIKFYNHR